MALWGLFIKFILLHQDLVFRAFSETKESPKSISEKACFPPTPRENILKLTVKSVSYRQLYHMPENMPQVVTVKQGK